MTTVLVGGARCGVDDSWDRGSGDSDVHAGGLLLDKGWGVGTP